LSKIDKTDSDFIRAEQAIAKKEELQKQGAENQRKAVPKNIDNIKPTLPPQQSEPPKQKHNTREIIAKDLGWSTGKVAQADIVLKKAPETIKQKLRTGDMSIHQAYKEVKRAEVKEQVKKKFEELKEKELQPITDDYDVVVIDPPWQMEKIERDVAPNQTGFDYPTMSIDEIKAMEISHADNCHLFMWITHKHLPQGFDILKAWGAKYVCTFVWHKNGGFQPFNLPQYNCEFILYARWGAPKFVETKQFFTCFDAKRTGHSAKPEEFYEVIRRVTAGKRIDIFNRRKIDGFDTWGNEA